MVNIFIKIIKGIRNYFNVRYSNDLLLFTIFMN
jgi:hypothetical protein